MGILTKEVQVKVNNGNYKYYENLGYEIPMREASKSSKKRGINYVPDTSKTINVKIEDLPKESHSKIRLLCDYCNEEIYELEYRAYLKGIELTGKCACKNCRHKKYEEANILKFGVPCPNQNKDILEKARQTCLMKYGVDSVAKVEEFQQKRYETNIEKYGVPNPTQSPDVRAKTAETIQRRYGVEYIAQSPIIIEKMKRTRLERYGFEHATQSPEIREKIAATYYKNSSIRTSRQQAYLCLLYNGSLNYPIKCYNADICLPEEKIYIEYDGSGHLLNVKTGHWTMEEFKRKEHIRYYTIKREGYKLIRISSSKDLLPQDTILLQMLSEARTYFQTYPSHSWIEYNISTSTVRNAEHKEGIPYDFGTLRTIKESDLQPDLQQQQTTKKGA